MGRGCTQLADLAYFGHDVAFRNGCHGIRCPAAHHTGCPTNGVGLSRKLPLHAGGVHDKTAFCQLVTCISGKFPRTTLRPPTAAGPQQPTRHPIYSFGAHAHTGAGGPAFAAKLARRQTGGFVGGMPGFAPRRASLAAAAIRGACGHRPCQSSYVGRRARRGNNAGFCARKPWAPTMIVKTDVRTAADEIARPGPSATRTRARRRAARLRLGPDLWRAKSAFSRSCGSHRQVLRSSVFVNRPIAVGGCPASHSSTWVVIAALSSAPLQARETACAHW